MAPTDLAKDNGGVAAADNQPADDTDAVPDVSQDSPAQLSNSTAGGQVLTQLPVSTAEEQQAIAHIQLVSDEAAHDHTAATTNSGASQVQVTDVSN